MPPSQDHIGMLVLHTLCQCHRHKTIQTCWFYTRSVSATVTRPYRHAGFTHALSVPPSQDHIGMLALHTLCQCHRHKTIQTCHRHKVLYTRSVSATVTRPYLGMLAFYTRSVSATVTRPYRHAGFTHALSVPPSQDHTGMLALHTLCQCHRHKTIQTCWFYTRSVSATVTRPYRHAGFTHALSVPPSQDYIGMLALHTLCQCHRHKTIQACLLYTRSVSVTVTRPYRYAYFTHALSVPPSQDHTGMLVLHTLCQCHRHKTIQTCWLYTRSVSATVTRPYRHAGFTHALSVPPSQDHTGMLVLHTLCQCHRHKTIQSPSQDHTYMLALHTLCQCHRHKTIQTCLHTLCQCHRHKTNQACWLYTRSVSVTVTRPYRHAGFTHALFYTRSVPPSQDHTGMLACHHRHALSVSPSQDHTGMLVLHTLCQCHRHKTIQACWFYTRSVSVTVTRPYRHAGFTHALSVSPSQDHTGMLALHILSKRSLTFVGIFLSVMPPSTS